MQQAGPMRKFEGSNIIGLYCLASESKCGPHMEFGLFKVHPGQACQ